MIFYYLKVLDNKNRMISKKVIDDDKIDDLTSQITSQISHIIINNFPKEIIEMNDKIIPKDDDDILSNFNHIPEKEYQDIVYYHNLCYLLIEYLNCIKTLKLNEIQKKKINNLIHQIYEKVVIYQKHIDLNPTNPVNSDLDDKNKKKIGEIGHFINKIRDITYTMLSKKSLKKTELLPFFNNAQHLFNNIINFVGDVGGGT